MRIGIISDAHGNARAFHRAIWLLKREGAQSFVFAGDAVGYLPGIAVVRALMDMGTAVRCVRGNHDAMLLDGWLSDADPVYQLSRSAAMLDAGARAFMESWPESLVLDTTAGRILVVHGSPSAPLTGYVYPDSDLAVHEIDATFVCMGHTHRPFVRKHQGRVFVNVGSCGLPRDVGILGSAALLDTVTGVVDLIRFDIREDLELAISELGPVHPDVRALLTRTGEARGRVITDD